MDSQCSPTSTSGQHPLPTLSRPNVESGSNGDPRPGGQVQGGGDAVIDGPPKALEIESLGRDNLFYASYRDAHPERQRGQTFTDLCGIEPWEKRKDRFGEEIHNEQIKVYEKLNEAEIACDSRSGFLNESGQGLLHTPERVEAGPGQARLELRETESRDAIKRELTGEGSVLRLTTPRRGFDHVPRVDGWLEP
jgi:hypothetical protein